MKKQIEVEEITAMNAAERLHMTKRNVIRMISIEALNARLVTEAPRPYYLITVDEKFIEEQKKRDQSAN